MSPAIAFARGLREHPPLPELEYAWLEAPLAAELAFARDVPGWRDPGRWPSGRVFGPAGEYRWRTADGGLHAVLLLDAGDMPPGFGAPLALEEVAESPLILWGDWVRPEDDSEGDADGGPRFFANELPGYQDYPLALDRRPAETDAPRLVVRTYRDAAGREGEFVRCVRVELRPREIDDD